MNTIRSYKERNSMVKRLISKTIAENLPVESVFYLFNENILQNIGKTSLCRWSTLLKIYEYKLLSYLILHFNKNIQIKPFDITYKHKILYIFKILILIMKYTFGHELYDFNQSIYEYTHSHDLDISYQALLFYNERFTFDEMNAQKCISDILKEHDNSTYLERDYNRKILLEIQDLLTKNTKLGVKNNIFEIQNKITNITLKMAEILKFEYYEETELQKLLALDILLTNILNISFHSFNEKILRYGVIFFIYSDCNEFFTNALYLLVHDSLYRTQKYNRIFLKMKIMQHISKMVQNENLFKNICHSNRKIFIYNFLNILKDFSEECSVDNIENQINKILNTRSFCIENIYQKLNLIIQKSIEREMLLIDFNETNLNDFIKSLTNLLDALIFSEKNHLFYRKLIEEESFNLTIINSFRFLETLRFINETRNADFAIKIFVSISKTLIKVLKNEKCFSRDLIDFIVNETLNFSLVQKPEKYKFYETDLFYELFEYYFTDEIPMSSLSFDNIDFLLKKILKVENNEYNLNMVDHTIKFYCTNVEFSLLLYNDNLKVNFNYEIFNICLKDLTHTTLGLDYVIEYICNENNRKIVDLELFDIHKSAFYAKSFVKNIHKYFEDKNKFFIDIFFYNEFHLKNLLSFLTNLFNYFDINLTLQNPNCIYLLIKRPEFLFFSEAKWLIWDIVKNITIKTSPSQDVYEFFFKFLEYTLERLSTCSFDKRSCSGVNERELSSVICYIIDFLMYLNDNIRFIYEIHNPNSKNEIHKKIFEIFKLIYSWIICCKNIPFIERDLNFLDPKSYRENIHNRLKAKEITVNKLYEICYISLLGILPRFGFPYTKLLYHILILPDTQNNSISITVLDTFHKLSNIALKYSADNKFLEADTDSIIFKSLDLFMFVINNMKDANLLYSSSKYFLQFIEDNIKIFTATIFMDLFTNKILKYLELIAVLCDIRLFDTITSIVHKIDTKSLKSLHTNNKIEKNTLLYDFLYFSFYKLKYSGIFINCQNTCESLFLFVYNEINENPDIHKRFIVGSLVNDVYSLYNILISNINTNITKDKKLPYKKETLFGFFDIYNLIIQEDVFIYAISSIRLSEFSNLFTKMELYLNFEFKRVLGIFSDKNDNLDLNANLYNYSYLYLRCMLEDDIYVLHSLMYIIRNYSNLSESVFIYFYSRLIIREKPTNISEFFLDESELDQKRKIIIDVFNIAKNGDGFKQPISLQILTELISTFPPLIYIIDFVDLMNLFYRLTVYSVFDDKLNFENQEIWYLNFKAGYFFTILLYRLDEEFMSKLVVGIIEKLSTSNIYEIYSIMSFLYKHLLSKICCCGYTQDIFCSAQEFCDSNCEKYFLERRLRIIDKFLTLGLLNMLLSVYNKHEVLYIYTMKIIEFVINLAEDKNYIFKRKFLMNDAFVARSSSKKNIFIPNFLEESVLNTIKQIELDNDGKIKETTRNHLPGCNYRFLYIFITSDAKMRISKYNFVIKKFASSDLFINKFGQNFDKLKFMKIISDYDFPDLFLLDLAKELGLETKSLAYYSENNTDSSSLLDEDHLISEKPSRFATILTIKQFAEIFLCLLVKNKKIYHTSSIKILKKIGDFCIRNNLKAEFYLILTKNIKSYKSEVKDEIALKKLEIIDSIFEEINFIEIFNSDFLTIEILMVIVKIFTHDNPSIFNKDSDLKNLIQFIFIERDCSSELFDSIDYNAHNSNTLYLQGFENLVCDLENFFVQLSLNSVDYILSYFTKISRILLHSTFITFLEDKALYSDYLFNLYNKLILKNSIVYISTRNNVFENEIYRMKRSNFIFSDFLCLLFDIKDLNFSGETHSRLAFSKLNSLYRFIEKIYKHKGNGLKSLDFVYSTDLTTKLSIIKMKNMKNIHFQIQHLSFELDRRDILNSTLNSICKFDKKNFKTDIWHIKFISELGEGVGLSYDFLTLFGRAIDKCLFFESFKNLDFYDMYKLKHEDDQYIKNLYFYTGLIMAKSIMMNATLGFQFIDSFYFYLLKDKFTVEDLKLVDNEFYRNIIKSRDVKNISSLELTFSISFGNSADTLEFIPDGSNISVTNSNIEDYLQITTEFKLFKNMIDDYLSDIFTLEELKLLIEGFENFDVDAWISATKYSKEFHINHKVIILFWEFIRESCVETQKKILYFVTGGFDSSKFQRNPFTIESSISINLLPRSQTCINLLFIPLYEDKETLIDKFLIAIECKEYGSI
ncbi:HECT domain-containing ubiquitin-transferase [Hamiltosporidium magnivora]|uniref:HECT-type E3 ubiquitin transferase n=1 Tax=Hamiltosporidium magnivora TaxID=148818 RepID=A0A4Q9LJ22_9MICR|nr:HECT domain-containing ubiquitin-transferase [Hamiltosporidium magnivora]